MWPLKKKEIETLEEPIKYYNVRFTFKDNFKDPIHVKNTPERELKCLRPLFIEILDGDKLIFIKPENIASIECEEVK